MNGNQIQNEETKSVGPAIGIILIILSLVIGSLYIWSQKIRARGTPLQPSSTTTYTTAPPITITATSSTSTTP